MPNVFISHAHDDRDFVNREIVGFLRRREIETWLSSDSIASGENFSDSIRRGIEKCDHLLVALTEKSLQSQYVSTEIELAFNLGKSIIPVLCEDCDVVNQGNMRLVMLHRLDFRQQSADQKDKLASRILEQMVEPTEADMDLQGWLKQLAGRSLEIIRGVPSSQHQHKAYRLLVEAMAKPPSQLLRVCIIPLSTRARDDALRWLIGETEQLNISQVLDQGEEATYHFAVERSHSADNLGEQFAAQAAVSNVEICVVDRAASLLRSPKEYIAFSSFGTVLVVAARVDDKITDNLDWVTELVSAFFVIWPWAIRSDVNRTDAAFLQTLTRRDRPCLRTLWIDASTSDCRAQRARLLADESNRIRELIDLKGRLEYLVAEIDRLRLFQENQFRMSAFRLERLQKKSQSRDDDEDVYSDDFHAIQQLLERRINLLNSEVASTNRRHVEPATGSLMGLFEKELSRLEIACVDVSRAQAEWSFSISRRYLRGIERSLAGLLKLQLKEDARGVESLLQKLKMSLSSGLSVLAGTSEEVYPRAVPLEAIWRRIGGNLSLKRDAQIHLPRPRFMSLFAVIHQKVLVLVLIVCIVFGCTWTYAEFPVTTSRCVGFGLILLTLFCLLCLTTRNEWHSVRRELQRTALEQLRVELRASGIRSLKQIQEKKISLFRIYLGRTLAILNKQIEERLESASKSLRGLSVSASQRLEEEITRRTQIYQRARRQRRRIRTLIDDTLKLQRSLNRQLSDLATGQDVDR